MLLISVVVSQRGSNLPPSKICKFFMTLSSRARHYPIAMGSAMELHAMHFGSCFESSFALFFQEPPISSSVFECPERYIVVPSMSSDDLFEASYHTQSCHLPLSIILRRTGLLVLEILEDMYTDKGGSTQVGANTSECSETPRHYP